ncbi:MULTISPECIES: hypothetical protein [Acinetobacter]|nr:MULTISPECIES: hypothetical protein [Acinetobacter]EXB32663.1 putative membrane protein [Acinetobacter sp. 1461402]EXC32707.1 putative membrane protein [Acinetobacter sp. 869535]EXE14403.1 putative membrane protein [Acinetobacter sp. 983759]WGX74015.1 hypothetical protein QJS67_05795 [Acinetobacter radioresistens]
MKQIIQFIDTTKYLAWLLAIWACWIGKHMLSIYLFYVHAAAT